MDNWRKLRQLSRFERRMLLKAVLLLPVIGIALRLFGFKRLQSIMIRLTLETKILSLVPKETLPDVKKTARMTRIAAVYGPYRGKCLEQSLALWYLLRRQGIKSDLRIGARKEKNRFEAHAWVEFMGRPLNETESVYQRFTPFNQAIIPLESRSS